MTRCAVLSISLVVVGTLAAWRFATSGGAMRPRAAGDSLVSLMPARTETAVFGAGCFWRVEAAFRKVPGVVATASGFAGGTVEEPSYNQVSVGATGHAEVVRVTFDPTVVSYERLLEAFWSCHDPTKPRDPDERQGGEPHRSVIFWADDGQRKAAEASKRARTGNYPRPIVTEIRPAATFWRAEEYHQQYLEKNGRSCPIR
jgi:peptide-methionine (S)-S-oxide reductase